MPRKSEVDLTGEQIGHIKVLEKLEKRYVCPSGKKVVRYRCMCEACGKENTMLFSTLRAKIKGKKSCGCIKPTKTHGKTKHPLYNTWLGMRKRCSNPNHKSYRDYGAKGIKVCPEWDDFEVFLKDMGPRPKGYSLDRINPYGDYEASNCKWSSTMEQSINKKSHQDLRQEIERLNKLVRTLAILYIGKD